MYHRRRGRIQPVTPIFPLSDGNRIPVFGLGTLDLFDVDLMVNAIRIGYRHIDNAFIFNNARRVSEAIETSIMKGYCKREDIFLTSKLWNVHHERDAVVPALKEILSQFRLPYIDLFYINYPVAHRKLKTCPEEYTWHEIERYDHDILETWKGMEECKELGLCKSIGVANFSVEQVKYLCDNSMYPPVVNQIPVNPLQNQRHTIKTLEDMNVMTVARSPFNSPCGDIWRIKNKPRLPLGDRRLIELSKKYNKSVHQIILRYILQNGAVPIPKAANLDKLDENLEVFDFSLTKDELEIMDTFNCLPEGVDNSYLP